MFYNNIWLIVVLLQTVSPIKVFTFEDMFNSNSQSQYVLEPEPDNFLQTKKMDPNDYQYEEAQSKEKLTIFIRGNGKSKRRVIGENFIREIEQLENPQDASFDDFFLENGQPSEEFHEKIEPYKRENFIDNIDPDDPLVSKIYWDINQKMPEEYWDPYKLQHQDGSIDNYKEQQKIGSGGFSQVFIADKLDKKEKVILKKLKPGRTKSINREIQILKHLQGASNVVQLVDAIRDKKEKNATIVYEYMNSTDLYYKVYKGRITLPEIKKYMFQLFTALNESHSRGIMHRDVKLSNTVVNEEDQKLLLIDWGIGDYYHPKKQYSTVMGTRNYKAPELLAHYKYYDYAIDVWAAGCMMAEMTFLKIPFFNGEDNIDMIIKQVKVLGSKDYFKFLKKYDLNLNNEQLAEHLKEFKGRKLKSYINRQNKDLATNDAIDLIGKILVYDFVKD